MIRRVDVDPAMDSPCSAAHVERVLKSIELTYPITVDDTIEIRRILLSECVAVSVPVDVNGYATDALLLTIGWHMDASRRAQWRHINGKWARVMRTETTNAPKR